MVIRIELKIVDQIGTPVSFWPKKGSAETLKAIVCQTAPLAKLPPAWGGGGGSYLFMKYDVFRQNTDFFKEGSVSSLIIIMSIMFMFPKEDLLILEYVIISHYTICNLVKPRPQP